MDHRLPATPELAREFSELFVNRRAYTLIMRPHPESGRYYHYRQTARPQAQPQIVQQRFGRTHDRNHAINPARKGQEWMAIVQTTRTLEDLISAASVAGRRNRGRFGE
jgi:hypothetical protein